MLCGDPDETHLSQPAPLGIERTVVSCNRGKADKNDDCPTSPNTEPNCENQQIRLIYRKTTGSAELATRLAPDEVLSVES